MKTQVLSKDFTKPPQKTLKHFRRTVLRFGDFVSPAKRKPEMATVRGFLPIDAYDFACVTREKRNGRIVKNRCLRDALWFVLHYYYPMLFSGNEYSPQFIERVRLFGPKVPDWFPVAGGTQFWKIYEALAAFRIRVIINGKKAESDTSVVWKLTVRFINPFGISFEKMITLVKEALSRAEPCVVFVPIVHLMDHALFIYGVDGGNLYCIDTHQANNLIYWNVSGDTNRFTMELPLAELKSRWNSLGMVWNFPLAETPNE